ncbi:hypothetical protein FB45DRAFT_899926 [Roridomyces roridus]|uniref:Uncharacterized protein n=1 Tax=Roridomyces roridus TaxID=1738132 RepID=A0AAD7C7X3_9AGAR|nr:hypothetical protein FB45DRAFT_899926 [Roridomyces roridus]
MGTRGFWYYYHNGWYQIHYNHWEGLGVDVYEKIPIDPEEYKKWLEALRESLDKEFELAKQDGTLEQGQGVNPHYSQDEPENDLFIEWIYGINLDHEVFVLNSFPIFNLKCMPPTKDIFLDSFGADFYGHDASAESQYAYNWTSPPPAVQDLDEYTTSTEDSALRIEDLLSLDVSSIGAGESARVAFYEVLVGIMMSKPNIAMLLRHLERLPDRNSISQDLVAIGVDMIKATLAFGSPRPKVAEYTWLSPDICLRISTHLDDERYRKKSVLELVREISTGGVKFGILFSFFHCLIVRVDEDCTFKCTAPLQFLPSWYARSPSTPGITALARLAYHKAPLPVTSIDPEQGLSPDHILSRIPEDVWWHIASDLPPNALLTLSPHIPQLQTVANTLLRYPHVGTVRLLAAKPAVQNAKCPIHNQVHPWNAFPVLVAGTFSGVFLEEQVQIEQPGTLLVHGAYFPHKTIAKTSFCEELDCEVCVEVGSVEEVLSLLKGGDAEESEG